MSLTFVQSNRVESIDIVLVVGEYVSAIVAVDLIWISSTIAPKILRKTAAHMRTFHLFELPTGFPD